MASRVDVTAAPTQVVEADHGIVASSTPVTYGLMSVGKGAAYAAVGTSLPQADAFQWLLIPGILVPVRFTPDTENLYLWSETGLAERVTIEAWPIT